MTMEQQEYVAEGHPVEENGGEQAGERVASSLHGLVDELDKLRETLGYNNQLEAIEGHLHSLQAENDELRSYAEEAIKEAERLATLNDELQGRLRQQQLDEQMGTVLAETQKLKDVADEFEKDLVFQKLAEAEERMAEIEALKGRVRELEDENVALTQTLNEFRQSTEQLQRLRMMESGHPLPPLPAGAPLENGSLAPAALGGAAGVDRDLGAPFAKAASAAESSPRSPAGSVSSAASASRGGGGRRAGRSAAAAAAGGAAAGAAVGAAAGAAAAGGSSGGHQRGESRDASRLAEQLAAAAGGADTGVVASAAKCLRDYASLEASLAQERQECERLRHEVEELRDTMFSKTFKAPSAWAEREVKYKMEKKDWEDRQKELATRVKELERENADYRAAGKAHEFEERIQELEAQLLQTEREKDGARAQLHELQISLRARSEGGPELQRYSPSVGGGTASGTPRSEGGGSAGVLGMVAELERQRIGIEPPAPAEGSRASLDQEGEAAGEAGAVTSGVRRPPKSRRLRELEKDRANADAAWEEHNKKSDVSSLRRAKAELETKVSMLEQQIGKMQWAIEHADQQQAAIEEQLDEAIEKGDVKKLTTLREKLKAGLASPSKVFRKKGAASPNKAAMSKQLHQTTDALRSSEAERNALRRQLAKLSRKYKAMAGGGAAGAAGVAAAGAVAGGSEAVGALDSSRSDIDAGAGAEGDAEAAAALAAELGAAAGGAAAGGAAAAATARGAAAPAAPSQYGTLDDDLSEFNTDELEEFLVPGIDDSEMEVLALREENELLMDQLVSTKVRLAETEGDFLQTKRELLRAQERQQQYKERLEHAQQAQQAAAQAHLAPLGAGAHAMAAALSSASPPVSIASKGGSTFGEEGGGGYSLSREVSASSVGGGVEGTPPPPVAGPPAAAGGAPPSTKRSKSWMGGLKI